MNISGTISLISDTHGSNSAINRWIAESREDNLLHCGDDPAGAIGYDSELERLGRALKAYGKKMFITRGNHCDPSWYDNRTYGDGSLTLLADNSVLHWTDTGENILVCGGGISLDRNDRKEGIDYWADEPFSGKYFEGGSVKIDHLITHVSIAEVTGVRIEHPFVLAFAANDADLIHDLYQEQALVRNYVDNLIENGHNLKTWHYGHYHRTIQSEYRGIKCRGLAIDEIVPFGDRKPFQ